MDLKTGTSVTLHKHGHGTKSLLLWLPGELGIRPGEDRVSTRAWRVFAYPNRYLKDRQGRIRYGAFGELSWDNAEVVAVIEQLLAEKYPLSAGGAQRGLREDPGRIQNRQ